MTWFSGEFHLWLPYACPRVQKYLRTPVRRIVEDEQGNCQLLTELDNGNYVVSSDYTWMKADPNNPITFRS